MNPPGMGSGLRGRRGELGAWQDRGGTGRGCAPRGVRARVGVEGTCTGSKAPNCSQTLCSELGVLFVSVLEPEPGHGGDLHTCRSHRHTLPESLPWVLPGASFCPEHPILELFPPILGLFPAPLPPCGVSHWRHRCGSGILVPGCGAGTGPTCQQHPRLGCRGCRGNGYDVINRGKWG